VNRSKGCGLRVLFLLLLVFSSSGQSEASPTKNSELKTVQLELRKTDQAIADISKKIRHTRDQIRDKNKNLKNEQSNKQSALKDLNIQESAIAQQARMAFLLSRQHQLKLVLNQEDPATVSRAAAYHDYLYRHRKDSLSQIESKLQGIETLLGKIHDEKEQLEKYHSDLRFQQKEMETKKREQEALIKSLRTALLDVNTNRSHMESTSAELESVAQNTSSQSVKTNGMRFAKLKGKLAWPAKGRVINRYGIRRPPGDLRWKGSFIHASPGTEVKAIAEGKIVFSDWLNGYGFLVIIDHGSDYMSLYAHNQTILAQSGQNVLKGDVIATVGNSGGQLKPGLYFEIRANGKPQNPKNWVAARKFM